MNNPFYADQFFSEVSLYIQSMSETGSAEDEIFVDAMTEKYSLPEDSEASLSVAIQFIRSVATLI